MRIRSKIALVYTQLTFMVLLGAFTLVYVLTSRTSEANFYDALWERAVLTAQFNFEKDEMPEQLYQNVANNYKFALDNESHQIFKADKPHIADSLKKVIPGERNIKELLQGRTVEFRRGDLQSIAIYYPDNQGNFIIVLSAYDRHGSDSQQSLLKLLLLILVSSTILVYLIGLLYARQVMAPVVTIINNVKRITAKNLKRSLREERGNDELSELSRTFNNMIERLHRSFEMQNSFIRNASHELRNPLTAILGETEIALSKPRSPEEYVQTLETVLVETERLNSMIKDLLLLAQTDFDFSRIPKENLDLEELLTGVADDVHKMFSGSVVLVTVDGGRHYEMEGAGSLLKLAFLNLIGNAAKFSNGHPVIVRIGMDDTKVKIEIQDKGIGIPQNELRNIFQPFYRAANTANYKGTGIGLALSERIVSLHSGKLGIVSEIGTGTSVTVIFRGYVK